MNARDLICKGMGLSGSSPGPSIPPSRSTHALNDSPPQPRTLSITGARKRKALVEEAIPLGGDGIELLPPSASSSSSLPASLKPFLDPLPTPASSAAPVGADLAQQQQQPSEPVSMQQQEEAQHPSYPSLVPKPLSAIVLPPNHHHHNNKPSPSPPSPTTAQQQPPPTAAISPLMQPPAPGSFVPCHPPPTHPAFLPPNPPQQLQQPAAPAAQAVAPESLGDGFPSLARRRELMDATIAKLKADMEAVRSGGGRQRIDG